MNYFNYYTEIEDTFIRRRGKHLFLSPLDWALMEAWQERGIPLHIVIRSIESVFDIFDKQPPGTRTIKSLFYCREEIEVQYNEWLSARVGAAPDEELEIIDSGWSENAVVDHIKNAIEVLDRNPRPELREDLDRAIARLEEFLANMARDPETIDSTLADVERLLEHSMLANWEKEHLTLIEKEVASQLRGYKAEMTAEAYDTTYRLMLLRKLREIAGIPRLGLYYL